ncbi:MAG TPA: hypothetical protein VID77_01325 [Stellaceae bacterium]|jgi:hypothetical protein
MRAAAIIAFFVLTAVTPAIAGMGGGGGMGAGGGMGMGGGYYTPPSQWQNRPTQNNATANPPSSNQSAAPTDNNSQTAEDPDR